MPMLSQILETCLYVNDIELAEDFYGKLLEQDIYAKDPGRHIFYKLGETMLLLFNPKETQKSESIPPHGAVGDGHVAFTVSHDRLAFWQKRLSDLKIEIECEYEWPSGGRSIYFRDPFHNSLELATPDVWP